MKKSSPILKYTVALFATVVLFALNLISCSDDVTRVEQACRLVNFGVFSQNQLDYDSIVYNANGSIAAVFKLQPGTTIRFDYSYTSNEISIYKTDLSSNHKLTCTIGLDGQGRPISRTEEGITYDRFYYKDNRLDHIMWWNKDSIAFSYNSSSKNPSHSEFYEYSAGSKSWSKVNTTTFTYDEKSNPLKSLILPIENWNLEEYFFYNNRTSYADDNNTFTLTYEYNSEGYPIARTLTFTGFSETKQFTYSCN